MIQIKDNSNFSNQVLFYFAMEVYYKLCIK